MFEHYSRILRRTWNSLRFAAARNSKRSVPRPVVGVEALEERKLLSASGKGARAELHSVEVHGRVAKILNGTPTNGFPSVVLLGNDTRNNCSGTLIGSQWVLTAAHCSTGVGDTAGRVTLSNGLIYATEEIFIHPDYHPGRFNSNKANDIALWKLSEPVLGVDPSPIYRETPQLGTLLHLVGYGSGGTLDGEDGDFGTKRVGTTPLEKVTTTRIRWVFDQPTDANTGHGDSGGPAFIEVGNTFYVAGVTSGGTKKNARKGDRSFDTRVDVFQNWIDNVMIGAFDAPVPQRQLPKKDRHSAHSVADNSLHDAVMSDIMQYV